MFVGTDAGTRSAAMPGLLLAGLSLAFCAALRVFPSPVLSPFAREADREMCSDHLFLVRNALSCYSEDSIL
jgi:hypothetical protein